MIQSQLIEYVIYMKEELKLSRNTIYSRLSAVEKFYETNDIELRWKKIKKLNHMLVMVAKRDQRKIGLTHMLK